MPSNLLSNELAYSNAPLGAAHLTRWQLRFGSPQPGDQSLVLRGVDRVISHNASWFRRGICGGIRSPVGKVRGLDILRLLLLRSRSGPAVSGFHNFAFLRGGMTVWASPMLLLVTLKDLQRLLVYSDMYLALQAAFRTAVLAGTPLTVPFQP
jgi:hypothetical protein